MIRTLRTTFLFAALLLSAAPVHAAANLVTNGNFETETINGVAGSGSYQFGSGYTANNVQLTGWTTNGYNFVFTPGSADTTGAQGQYGNVALWGPNNGSANGMPAYSPSGANFIAADGNAGTAAITQTVTGLTVGNLYQLTFWWAAAQQKGFDGVTTENWTVAFGNQSFTTATVTNASHGFVGWTQVTMMFTASAASQTLSFLAAGTPNGAPPFSLLDGVVLTQAPEPATWAILMVGLGGVVLVTRRRTARRNGATQPG